MVYDDLSRRRSGEEDRWVRLDIALLTRNDLWAMGNRRKSFNDALRKAIKDHGQTYTVLLRATGVNRASILRFMGGDQTLRLDIADRLAEHLGIEVELKQRK